MNEQLRFYFIIGILVFSASMILLGLVFLIYNGFKAMEETSNIFDLVEGKDSTTNLHTIGKMFSSNLYDRHSILDSLKKKYSLDSEEEETAERFLERYSRVFKRGLLQFAVLSGGGFGFMVVGLLIATSIGA